MAYAHRGPFVRDAVVATAVLAGLYALVHVRFQPLQIPGYLLLVGFGYLADPLESAGVAFPVSFGAYLVALGAGGAVAARLVRTRTPETGRNGWRLGAASALGVVGLVSLLFAAGVLLGTSQLEPVGISGATGLVLLGLAGWLAGLFEPRTNW